MLGLGAISKKIFGTANDRKVRTATKQVAAINALEPEISALSDEDLKARTEAFRARVAGGETLDQLLPEAFAVVREAAKRAIGLRPFDVQLVGGIMLHEGRISEMKTGEGKTLVATLPTYLNALEGKGVHVVTVNDYLAKRDAEWMGKVYGFLGLTTGVVVPGVDDRARKAAYACDVTYATNNELGFDYLRDNMKYRLEDMVQRGHRYAIVDEVDSILIDEARTPLIISGPTEDQSQLYIEIDKIIPQLDETHYEIDEKARQTALTEEGNEAVEQALREAGYLEGEATLYDPENVTYVHHVNQALRAHKLFTLDKDYIVKGGKVVIIDEFTGRMMDGRRWGDGLHQAVEAKEDQPIQPENVTLASVTFQNYFRLYRKLGGMTGTAMTEAEEFGSIYGLDVVEIPTNKPVQRADDDDQVFRTGREKFAAIAEAIKDGVARGQPMLVGTTSIEKSEALSELLKAADVPHQVLNARHHEQEAQIVAQAGHPGAVTIATNMAGRGTDIQLGGNYEMAARRAIAERFTPDIQKVAQEAAQAVLENQPPLEDERQAQARANFIVQLIGQQAATQEMARLMKEAEDGLHEDVVGPIKAEIAAAKQKALDAGGLWVIATERHESRRIDNQLRGRSGRQGDPGRSTFYLSLEDDLMRIFGSERMESVLSKLGLEEGEAIVHTWVNKAIERAQGKVEARNFDIRKNLLKFDDVMNEQRKAVFGQRREIMDAEDVAEIVGDMRETLVDDLVSRHIPERAYADQWDVEGLAEEVERFFGVALPVAEWADEEGVDDEAIRERLNRAGEEIMARKVAKYGRDVMRQQEKGVVLQTIDQHWREHLVTLDHLRSVIGLRGYAQRDPLNEYKSEAFQLFESLLTRLRGEVTAALARFEVAEAQAAPAPGPEASPSARPAPTAAAAAAAAASAAGGAGVAVTDRPAVADVNPDDPESWGKVGRNDACPCGSGRKYKHCHGRHG